MGEPANYLQCRWGGSLFFFAFQPNCKLSLASRPWNIPRDDNLIDSIRTRILLSDLGTSKHSGFWITAILGGRCGDPHHRDGWGHRFFPVREMSANYLHSPSRVTRCYMAFQRKRSIPSQAGLGKQSGIISQWFYWNPGAAEHCRILPTPRKREHFFVCLMKFPKNTPRVFQWLRCC